MKPLCIIHLADHMSYMSCKAKPQLLQSTNHWTNHFESYYVLKFKPKFIIRYLTNKENKVEKCEG